jgi:DNA-binding NarL/FixJ family response regulator
MTYESLSSATFSKPAWDSVAGALRLSRRELDIVRGMFDGLTEFAIASRLRISLRTVHTHVERLHRKLGVTHQVTLVLRVMAEFLNLAGAPASGVAPICARHAAGNCRYQL